MPSLLPGGFFFCTHLEAEPWISIDLSQSRTIGEIVIWNREEVGIEVSARANPLTIEASDDAATWRVLEQVVEPFGGRLSDNPYALRFPNGERFRYLRLVLGRSEHLHLDYVEIVQFSPNLIFGRAVGLTRDRDGVVSCEYIHQAINGLYSGFTTALHDVTMLAKAGIAVRRVDLSMSFVYFKDRTHIDAYDLFFDRVKPLPLAEDLVKFELDDVHRAYKDLPLRGLKVVAGKLFPPSASVHARAAELLQKAGLDVAKTIAVVYRGTDKSTEVTLAPISDYVDIVRQLRKRYPNHLVLIQTDQEQAQQAFIDAFGSDCRHFDSLPVTSGSTVLHLEVGRVPSRQRFAEDVMAAIQAVVRCDVVVTHTGNIGAWIAFYRGGTENLYQFDSNGILVLP